MLQLSDLQGYVDAIRSLIDGHLLDWILVSVGIFLFPMQRSPTVAVEGEAPNIFLGALAIRAGQVASFGAG